MSPRRSKEEMVTFRAAEKIRNEEKARADEIRFAAERARKKALAQVGRARLMNCFSMVIMVKDKVKFRLSGPVKPLFDHGIKTAQAISKQTRLDVHVSVEFDNRLTGEESKQTFTYVDGRMQNEGDSWML